MSQKIDCEMTHVVFNKNNTNNNCDYHLCGALMFTKYFHIITLSEAGITVRDER